MWNNSSENLFLREYQHHSATTFNSISLLIFTLFYSFFYPFFIASHPVIWEKLFYYLVNVAKIICLFSLSLFFKMCAHIRILTAGVYIVSPQEFLKTEEKY